MNIYRFGPGPCSCCCSPPLDTFTDDDGVLLVDHDPDIGCPWNRAAIGGNAGGDIEIKSNRASVIVTGGAGVLDAAVIDTSISSCEIKVTVNLGVHISGITRMGVVLRYTDSDNLLLCEIDALSQSLQINKYQDSIFTRCAEIPFLAEYDTEYELNVTADGANITFTVNSTSVFCSDSHNEDAVIHGIVSVANGVVPQVPTFDDFEVTAI